MTRSSTSLMMLIIFIRYVPFHHFLFKPNILILGHTGVEHGAENGDIPCTNHQMLVNKAWFQGKKDNGMMHPEFFEDEMLSLSIITLVLTIVSPYFYFLFIANEF